VRIVAVALEVRQDTAESSIGVGLPVVNLVWPVRESSAVMLSVICACAWSHNNRLDSGEDSEGRMTGKVLMSRILKRNGSCNAVACPS
jgi:hypothetical protein